VFSPLLGALGFFFGIGAAAAAADVVEEFFYSLEEYDLLP
jgi:hypothetical protein